MNVKRTMKGDTHIRRVLENLDLNLGKAEVRKLARALRDDDAFAEIRVYHDGWVAKSYRYPAPGQQTTVRIEGCGFSVQKLNYDRKRSGGRGPLATCYVGREDQSQGRPVWSV